MPNTSITTVDWGARGKAISKRWSSICCRIWHVCSVSKDSVAL